MVVRRHEEFARAPPGESAGRLRIRWELGFRMGLERKVRFPGDAQPTWETIHKQLARVGEAPPLRMIDGMPAFPDEIPDPAWKELRIGFAAGMVTIRRGADGYSCIVWGNAEPALDMAWNKVVWACAAAGGGTVETPEGPRTAAEFARFAGLSPE